MSLFTFLRRNSFIWTGYSSAQISGNHYIRVRNISAYGEKKIKGELMRQCALLRGGAERNVSGINMWGDSFHLRFWTEGPWLYEYPVPGTSWQSVGKICNLGMLLLHRGLASRKTLEWRFLNTETSLLRNLNVLLFHQAVSQDQNDHMSSFSRSCPLF